MFFDLFVIGGGSGGVRAARIASQNGLKVGLAEAKELGGTCVNRGCIPKKLYSYASHFPEEVNIMRSYGWNVGKKSFNWKKLVSAKKKELLRLNNIYKNILKNSGVNVFNNWASFYDNQKIILNNKKIIEAKNIIIAVGSKPKLLDIEGAEYCIDSDSAFDLKNLPRKILIVGGGYIALEFASIFNGLGVDTSVCLRSNIILRGFDEEVSKFLCESMEEKGIKFFFNQIPKKVEKKNREFEVTFKNSKKSFDQIMSAIGRSPMLEGLNIEKTKIKVSRNGAVKVNDYFQTYQKNIFAIGDVIDRVQLTPVAISEAMNIISNLTKQKKKKMNYKNVPTAVFSNPNVGTIGLSEKEAKLKNIKIKIFKTIFKPLKLTLGEFSEKIFIKMVVDLKSNKVLGLHYVGDNAAEIIQGFSVAIVKGLKKTDFDNTIGIHPSSAEEIVTLK